MKVLHVIPDISKTHGGPSRSCQGLVKAQCEAGVEAWIFTTWPSDRPWIADEKKYVNASEKSFATVLDELKPDLVHIHSIWNLDLHRAAVTCRECGVPYVIAPRGMLEPWSLKQGWLKKRIARFLYQDRDLRGAAALHATAESEEAQFRKLGLKQKVIVSPNGVNLPEGDFNAGAFGTRKFEQDLNAYAPRNTADGISTSCSVVSPSPRRALFMSRMHQKKGVAELIEAWSSVPHEGWTLELVYTVRNDDERAYEQKCKELAKGDESIIFTGALDDEKKWEAYARANLFVLPTHSENFGIVVAEALWAGVPVITTKGTPWSELEGCPSSPDGCAAASGKAGWWIDIGVEPLIAALKEAMSLDSLSQMGANGHALVERKYTWKSIGERMVKEYEALLRK